MAFRLHKHSYRFAEQVLNSNLAIKQELDQTIQGAATDIPNLSRPNFNKVLDDLFVQAGWQRQPYVFGDPQDPGAKMDFLKSRTGVEVGFGHASFLGIDLLKFQVSSYSALDKIDVGVYVTTTKNFQSNMKKLHNQNWDGSLTYEKVLRYLPHLKSAIQVPIYVIGIDL